MGALCRGVVPRRRPPGDRRLPVRDERGVVRVASAACDARRRHDHGTVPCLHALGDREGVRSQRVPHQIRAPAVCVADRVPQSDRLPTIHALVGECPRPGGSARPVWLAGHARRRTVRVLVTGAAGFTGGHLARALAARGDAVSALVRREGPAASALERAGVALVIGDLRDRDAVAAATDGVEVVYHIAAMYRQAGLGDDVYRAVNATAVREVVEAAARAGVRRVVHCSTVGVHGDVEHPPADEDAPLKPGDVYQVTKLEGERLAREAGARLGLEVTIARPTGIYGPGDRRLLKLFRGVA